MVHIIVIDKSQYHRQKTDNERSDWIQSLNDVCGTKSPKLGYLEAGRYKANTYTNREVHR